MKRRFPLMFLISYCILQAVVLVGCKKQEETDYFKCKVDGVSWEADHGKGLGDYPLYAYLYSDTSLRIYARNGAGDFYISILEDLYVGIHEFGVADSNSNRASYDNDPTMNYYSTDSLNTGYLIIESFNLKGLRIKGSISFRGIDTSKTKTIHVTEGTFSIPLQKHY